MALVVRPDPGVTADELAEHASASIARYILPKDWQLVPHIQRSPSGKADYRWAKQQVVDHSATADSVHDAPSSALNAGERQ